MALCDPIQELNDDQDTEYKKLNPGIVPHRDIGYHKGILLMSQCLRRKLVKFTRTKRRHSDIRNTALCGHIALLGSIRPHSDCRDVYIAFVLNSCDVDILRSKYAKIWPFIIANVKVSGLSKPSIIGAGIVALARPCLS